MTSRDEAGYPLSGKVMIITGGASGMGRSTALLCARLGAAVALADLDGEGAAAVVGDIESAGGTALACRIDVTSEVDVATMVATTVERFGTVHVLHNNAYAVHPGAFGDLVNTTLEAWDWTMRTCLTSQFLCARATIPHMLAHGNGSIINVSSGNGVAGAAGNAAYGAAKAATLVLTKYIAAQYGKQGIRCNAIVPGWTIRTGWTHGDDFTEAHLALFERALDDVCMDRLAEADDVAPVVAFLASDAARYVQAATIDVNGGLLAHMPGAAGMKSSRAQS
jgi:NAD(P)-dependent dehydrogenase (short-subunit alcohol dehydrogenase family)